MTNSEVERPIITVIDYQAGNIRSVEKALEKSGASVKVSGKASDLENRMRWCFLARVHAIHPW